MKRRRKQRKLDMKRRPKRRVKWYRATPEMRAEGKLCYSVRRMSLGEFGPCTEYTYFGADCVSDKRASLLGKPEVFSRSDVNSGK